MTGQPDLSRYCVYTVMIGRYETLNEQPQLRESKLPSICFTDDPELTSDSWEIRQIRPRFPMDPVRSQRDIKIRPHLYLPDFEASLYIDNTVVLNVPPEQIIDAFASPSGVAMPTHSYRKTLLDEFIEVMRLNYDDASRIAEQLNHYAVHEPDLLSAQPLWSGLMIREHHRPEIIDAMETWLAHVLRYSRRDQLSSLHAFRSARLAPRVIEIDIKSSWFHSWPVRHNRDTGGTRQAAESMLPPVAITRRLELRLARLEAANAQLQGKYQKVKASNKRLRANARSLPGRVASILRRVAKRIPGLAHLAAPKSRADKTTADHVLSPTGKTIYVDTRDARGRKLVKAGGVMNQTTLEIWSLLLARQSWTHIVDVGANYGEMFLSTPISAQVPIIAVEPNQNILPFLRRSVTASGLPINIREVAIARTPGTVQFVADKKWSGLSHIVDDAGADSAPVPAITLDMLLSDLGPATRRVLLKVDVEGHEADVIASGLKSIAALEDFQALVEVLHDSPKDLEWLLQNFEISLYHLERKALVPAPDDLDGLQRLLRSGEVFRQDAVLSRKQSTAPSQPPATSITESME